MTPSAARGVLEAIVWKPAIRWRVERIKVLSPIVFTAFRRNEVGSVAPKPPAAVISGGGHVEPFFVEERRQQRNTVALRDVDYIIEARFELTEKAGPDDNKAKFVDMFRRRVQGGQHFHHPYLGCREFPADVRPVNESIPAPIPETRDLGLMLWDIDYAGGGNTPVFFPAELRNGILEVPADPRATATAEQPGGAE